MRVEPREEIRSLEPGIHGGQDLVELRRLGLDPAEVLDFSANTNAYGPSPAVREALEHTVLESYPDRRALALRQALAEDLDVSPDVILVGNGASELLWLVALAYLRPRDCVVIGGPTYGEYARVAGVMGASVTTYTVDEEDGFVPNLEELSRCLDRLRPRLVFVCNPNNPTGVSIPANSVRCWARLHSETLFVVDEAYLAFSASVDSVIGPRRDNVLIVRSMTKDFGLAGVRLGFAVGGENVISWLGTVQPPWSVNAVAQAAGIAALRDRFHVDHSLRCLVEAKEDLREGLVRMGFSPLPSATHFFLVPVEDGAAFRSALLTHGILVRDCASFGLPAYVRIAARRPEENRRLLGAVGEVLAKRGVSTNGGVTRARSGKPRNGKPGAGGPS